MKQFLAYTVQRHVRYILLGAVTTCFVVNVAVNVGVGLQYICEEECTLQMLQGRYGSFNKHIISYVKEHLLHPPAPRGSFSPHPPYDVTNPPWAKLGSWGKVHDLLRNYFKASRAPGTFVEVGAQDGEFMSFTLFLESLNYTGLLIEPNPKDYAVLRSKRRSAYSINACAHPEAFTAKEDLWIRHSTGKLPPLLARVQAGSNRLLRYVAMEDQNLGDIIPVQCLPLGTMIHAALGTTLVDLLTISTHGGELDIISNMSDRIQIRSMIVLSSLLEEGSVDYLNEFAKKKGLIKVHSSSNIHVFMPANEFKVVLS